MKYSKLFIENVSIIFSKIMFFLSNLFWMGSKREDEIHSDFLTSYYYNIKYSPPTTIIHHDTIHPLRCCTWNIHRGFDSKWNFKIPSILDYLNNMDFDIIFLQELPNKKYSKYDINYAEFLSSYLGLHYIYDRNQCILSKFPLYNKSFNSYFLCEKSYGNHLLSAYTLINDDIEIKLHNIHLNCDITGYEQRTSLRQLELDKSILNCNSESKNMILAGDFNAPSWFSISSFLSILFGETDKNKKNTFPTTFPFLNFDKVWINEKKGQLKLEYICVDYSIYFSDHKPILFELFLEK